MPFGASIGAAVAGGVASAGTTALLSGGSGGGGGAAAAADPFSSQRMYYQNTLQNLLGARGDPSAALASTPGYQFQLNQGLQAVQGSAAANGMLNSGNVLTALQKQGAGMASQDYWNQVQFMAQLAGANIGSPGEAGQIQANQGYQNQQSASALGNQVGNLVQQGVGSLFGGGGYSGGNPFATDTSGYGAGSNTYGFSSGVSDPSYGVSGGMFGG